MSDSLFAFQLFAMVILIAGLFTFYDWVLKQLQKRPYSVRGKIKVRDVRTGAK